MVEYAPLDLTASMKAVPGTSRMFRLPTMMPGEFHITATGYSLPGFIAVAAATPAAPATRPTTAIKPALAPIGIGTTGDPTKPIGIDPIGPTGPTGPTGPIIPPTYPLTLDIFHGNQLMVSGSPPPIQQSVALGDDSWRMRVNFPAQSQPTDTIQFSLMPYTSTLPILTRKIPLWFFQQGFNNNWNGRNYISIAFENSTLYIRFDPEIASYYHLTEQDIAVATIPTEVPPNMMVKDIQLRADSSSGGFEELAGPLPYFEVTVTVGGIDGQQIKGSVAGFGFTISDFSVIVKFYITTATGVVENAQQTVVGYRTQVTTDLLDQVAGASKISDAAVWIAKEAGQSDFYNKLLPALQNKLDSYAGVVGAAITPWLLGAAYTVWNVNYNPNNSQTIPLNTPKRWVPQGDLVITYFGLAETGSSAGAVLGNQLPTTVLTITSDAPDGVVGKAYALTLTAAGGKAPYTWSTTGTLPPGVALSAGSLQGTPTTQGAYSFQAKVIDASGATTTRAYAVAVNTAGFSIATSSPLPRAVVGDAYAAVLAASGGSGQLHWSATGVPAGLTLSTTGILSGTPTGDGSLATIIVQAVDANNAVARHAFSLTILDALLFGEHIYTPRGAGTAMYSPPQPAAPSRGPTQPVPPVSPGNLSKIDHIVVLMMENRSFDHMLGYLSREGGRSDIEGLKWENDSNRTQFNFYNGNYYYPNQLIDTHLFNPESIGPDHSFESVKSQMNDNMGHFVSDYARNKITDDDPAQLSQVMGYYTGEQLGTYATLAREFAICDHWFCSHPGPTWPNRFVTLTGDLNRDSYGEVEVNTPLYSDFTPSEATTIFDLLPSSVTWQYFEQRVSTMRAYTKYTFDMTKVLEYSDPDQGFAATVGSKTGLANVTFVDPLFGDLPAGIDSPQDNDDAPPSNLADGQRFVWEVVDTLFTPASNPNWEKTMLVIVYDEHGGFYDHVQPPINAVPLAGQTTGKLGPRVPAFVVSPYTPAGLVLKNVYDHTSIAATILRRFCAPHPPFLSARVSAALDLRDALPLAQARGQLSPILGLPTQVSPNALRRTEARAFTAPSAPDSFGSLLGAMALMLGKGGS